MGIGMEPLVDLCIARVKRAGSRMRRSERAGTLDDLRVARWMLGRLGLTNPQLDALIRDIERELGPDGAPVDGGASEQRSGRILPMAASRRSSFARGQDESA
jgi:hypothetical protein